MRTVVVAHSTVFGGAESYLVRLHAQLRKSGDRPVLVGSLPSWSDAGLEERAVRMGPKWGVKTIVPGLLRLESERRRVNACADTLAPDLFHLQFKREQIGFTDALAKRAPVVWTEHGAFLRGAKGALLAAAYKQAARKTSLIICVSSEVAKDVRRVIGPGPRIDVVENSVDTAVLRPPSAEEKASSRARLNISAGEPVLLWIGRLHSGKRAEFAVDLANEWPGTTLVAGTGPLLQAIEQATRTMPKARVLGHIDDTSDVFRAADVMAFTSMGASEGYPTTTMVEAASYGVPFIADELSGAARVVVESGGKPLVAGAQPSDWVEALTASISVTRSDVVRKWAEMHDVNRWAQRHKELFDSAVEPDRRYV